MWPVVAVAVVLGAFALAARDAKAKQQPQTEEPADAPDVDLPDVDDDLEEEEPAEVEIPLGDGLVWEVYVLEDGRLVAEGDDELVELDDLVELDVCPGDTIVIRTPPQAWEDDALPFQTPGTPWLELIVSSWETGDFAWAVHAAEGQGLGVLPTADVGVEVFDYDAQAGRPYGFQATLSDDC